ncbi:hypothetical protein Smp_156310 [Schistosoma mansoni]|uniref:Uncharacterized protein n=1 Tax=Schistosoma mansoni TaxID=6183 RepID=G4VF85_SCHMA|nr:hypothetical protein Smp_156310 [Schistosoma mansoni]|eukprot:XP_018651203.1 hypothetical protein Smp_156310 [Schistosoma mansoni]
MFLCILVTFGHGFCLLFNKLLKFIESVQNDDERKQNSNNHDITNESRIQVSSSSLNQMMNQNLFMRNMSNLDQYISSPNVKTRLHFNQIKPKYKCFIRDHVKIPLNQGDQNHRKIIDLTRINRDQCLLIHNEVRSKKQFNKQSFSVMKVYERLQTKPILFSRKA